jgi:glycosidase
MKKRILFILIPLLLFYGLPIGAVEKEDRSWQDESIYYITIDRFNNSDFSIDYDVNAEDPERYHGGDFEGILVRLDYIKDMGFTTIGLSSILDNEKDGYHGYWTQDFYKTEEHFGSIDKFKELVQEAHKRDMRIIVDLNVNHVGQNHPWLSESDKKEWFHPEQEITNENDAEQLETGWVEGLPDLAQENPEVSSYLIDAAKWWIEETDIDGYRLDAVEHVPVDFWKEFANEIKETKDDFFLLGDVRSDNDAVIQKYQEAGIDGFFDYGTNGELRTAFSKPDQSLEQASMYTEQNREKYENPYFLSRFMDNQYTQRFTRDTVVLNEHPGPRWKLALTYLYTTPGIPFVYYGSEIALDGGEEPDNQRQMDFRTDKELVDYITSIAKVREQYPSLSRGSYELLHEENGMIVYKREYDGETTVVALNNTTKSQEVTLSASVLEDDMELRGVLNGDLVRSDDGNYPIILDRDETEIYLLAEKTGLNIPFVAGTASVVILFIGFLFLLKRRAKKAND